MAENNSGTPPGSLQNEMNPKGVTRLSQLIQGCQVINVVGTLEKDISSIVFDSRKAEARSLFVAIPGLKQDGGKFIRDAVHRGAAAFITEMPDRQLVQLGLLADNLTAICVKDSRHALSSVSGNFFNHPSRRLSLTGISGTNGKTTVTYILESLYKSLGKPTGVLGTVNYRYGNIQAPAAVTTPESLDINRMLNEMTQNEIKTCFMEVSSHALSLKRVFGMYFKVGVFTNLSRDHLDFHGTMEDYKRAKFGLFRNNFVEKAVINTDDPAGREILPLSNSETLTVGIDFPADLRAENCELSEKGSRFTLKTPLGSRAVKTHLLGKHNIYNLLCGAGVALSLEISLDDIQGGFEEVHSIPGRFEKLDEGQKYSVVVDYAHTDDALKNILTAGKTIARNKVIVVFGCGGDRDKGKRKEMGRIALELSDYAVITSDNPRSEDPHSIISDILKGVPSSARENNDFAVIEDRRDAIIHAVNQAEAGDLVIIAGKGHENYQILKSGTIPFDDREIAIHAINKRSSSDSNQR